MCGVPTCGTDLVPALSGSYPRSVSATTCPFCAEPLAVTNAPACPHCGERLARLAVVRWEGDLLVVTAGSLPLDMTRVCWLCGAVGARSRRVGVDGQWREIPACGACAPGPALGGWAAVALLVVVGAFVVADQAQHGAARAWLVALGMVVLVLLAGWAARSTGAPTVRIAWVRDEETALQLPEPQRVRAALERP